MKKIICLILSISFLFSTFAFADFSAAAASKPKTYSVKVKVLANYDYSMESLKVMNKERKKRGLKPLTMSKELFDIAYQRAAELCVMYYNYADGQPHRRPDGTPAVAIKQIVTENSAGKPSCDFPPKEVITTLIKSKAHRPVVLNPTFKATGLACVVSDNSCYWIQVFSRKKPKKAYSKKGKEIITKNIKIKKDYYYLNVCRAYPWDDSATPNDFYLGTRVCDGALVEPSSVSYTYTNKDIVSISKDGHVKFKKPGKTKVTAKIKGIPKKSFTATFECKQPMEINLSNTTFVYNGSQQLPEVTHKLTDSKYSAYNFHYARPESSINVGGYAIFGWMERPDTELSMYYYDSDNDFMEYGEGGEAYFTGAPNYEGCSAYYCKHYQIIPQSTALLNLTKSNNSVNVSWIKQDVQTTGYEIQYSANSDFSNSKTIKIKNNSKTSAKISSLKSNKKY